MSVRTEVEEPMTHVSVHLPSTTPVRVVRHEEDEIVSLRLGDDGWLRLDLDALVPIVVEALTPAPSM